MTPRTLYALALVGSWLLIGVLAYFLVVAPRERPASAPVTCIQITTTPALPSSPSSATAAEPDEDPPPFPQIPRAFLMEQKAKDAKKR